MKALINYINRMDERAQRAVVVAVALLLVLIGGFAIGQILLDEAAENSVGGWLVAMRESGWGLPATIALFSAAAMLAAPQTLLIGITVFAFGFMPGVVYAWIATLVSSSITFALGRLFGADALDRLGGGAGRRIAAFVGSNGFTASLVIRLVPSAPFIVVNMALGAAGVRYPSFIGGTALGIIPKALLIGGMAGGVVEMSEGGDWRIALGLAALAAAWVALGAFARKRLRRPDS